MTTSRREAAAVWALAFGQTLGYACFFYIFAALVIRRFGDAAQGPIVKVTAVAGLAYTLAFPAGAALAVAGGDAASAAR